jgi:Flp pilus assembly protein TadG
MSKKLSSRFHGSDFATAEGGNVIMMFGLSFIPVMLMLGAASDYTRYTTVHSTLQQGTDAAVLTVASRMTSSTTVDQATRQAQVILNTQPALANATITNVTISSNFQSFCATSQVTIQNSFMRMAHIASLTPSATSCAALAGDGSGSSGSGGGGNQSTGGTTYEIALVLDNSGSMNNSTNGQSKIQALKTAANSFVGTMFTKSPNNVKFSIVPFAGGVVAIDPSGNRNQSWIDTTGQNSQHWTAFGGKTAASNAGFGSRFDIYAKLAQRNSALDWRGCFEEPVYPYNVNADSLSTSNPETLMVPYLAPDEPSSSYNYFNSYLSDSGPSSTSLSSGSNPTCTTMTSNALNARTEWSKLTNVCKYKTTSSLNGNFGPSAFFGPNQFCPDNATQLLLPMTSTQSSVSNKINQLVANGNTALHTGFMWGWRTIAPGQPFAAGRAYTAPNNRKIIVFMTDGFNNWGTQTGTAVGSDYEALGYYSNGGQTNPRLSNGAGGVDPQNYQNALNAASGSNSSYLATSRKALDDLTLEACNNAKSAGVEIYTIGFSIPTDPIDTQGLTMLQNCATNASHYFAASNADQLNAAFTSIGLGLGKLRLSQ